MEAVTTTRTQPKLGTLVHFEIPASDPATVSKFYEQLFGWKFAKFEGGTLDYWLISHKDAAPDDTIGGLFKRMGPDQGFINYFSVKSVDESAAKASAMGAKVKRGKQEIPNVGYFAILADPDGNTFALFESTGGM
jgi:predicted enzyme related to lactoylglutathione lyase